MDEPLTNPAVSPPVNPVVNDSAKGVEPSPRHWGFKTILLLALGGVIVLLGLFYLVLVLFSRPKTIPVPTPKPKVVIKEEIIETPPLSKFASDSAIISLRTSLQQLQGKIDTVDFYEAQITPPLIDTSIAIQP